MFKAANQALISNQKYDGGALVRFTHGPYVYSRVDGKDSWMRTGGTLRFDFSKCLSNNHVDVIKADFEG